MNRIPSQIGNYILEHEIGRGATSEVWLARHAHLEQRQVAIKLLMAQDRETVQRFSREASMLSHLRHPHIVQVYDYGYYAPFYCTIMQYVHGGALRHVLEKQTSLQPQDALAIFKQIADALDFAHSHDVIHRDVSPGNILIDQVTGCAYLTDFGIARSPQGSITVASAIMGTPGYWSPEHAQSAAAVTHLSDIYSLGVIFYVMLSGALPWKEIPDLPERNFSPILPLKERGVTNLPSEVDRLFQTMLAEDPAKRFPSAQTAVAEFERVFTRHFVTTQRIVPLPDATTPADHQPDQFQAKGIEPDTIEAVLGPDLVRAPIIAAHKRAEELCRPAIVANLLNTWSTRGRLRKRMLGRLAYLHKISSRNIYFYTLQVLYERRDAPQDLEDPDYDAQELPIEPERDYRQVRLPPPQDFANEPGSLMAVPGSMRVVRCGDCDGRGATVCRTCKGKGRVRTLRPIEVSAPSAPQADPSQTASPGALGRVLSGTPLAGMASTQPVEEVLVPCADCEGRGKFHCERCDGVGRLVQQKAFHWQRKALTLESQDDVPDLNEHWLHSACESTEIYRERSDNGFRPEWSQVGALKELMQEAEASTNADTQIIQSEVAIWFIPISDIVFDLGQPDKKTGEKILYKLSIYGFEHTIPSDWRFLNWERVIFLCVTGFLAVLVLVFGFFAFTA